MELFQRVEAVLAQKKVTKTRLAEMLGVPQSTLTMYFSVKRQDKLTPYLWKISSFWPDISRDWLFFGEGDMTSAMLTAAQMGELKKELNAVRTELTEERKKAQASQEAQRVENERLRSELERVNRLYQNVSAKLLLGDTTEDSAERSKKSSV